MKRQKWIKKALCLIFVFLLSINSFAVVVSDNDGSAFITKAEFDSLKNDFQSQLDSYNTSIDSKIDSAIASYLAGISIEKTRKIDPIISNYQDIRWMHGPYMYFTNRRFTAYADADGNYVDTTAWQIINPDNRRGCSGDGYTWFHDQVRVGFKQIAITMMLHPFDVPWAWGCHRNNVAHARGPSIFAALTKEGTKWAVYNKDGGFQAEQGHASRIYTRIHGAAATSGDFGNVLSGNTIYQGNNNSLTITNNGAGENELLNYTINNIKWGWDPTWNTNGSITTIIRQDWNPSFIESNRNNLWATGTGGVALKTGCGYAGYMGDNYSRVGSSLVEDNRWQTETQFKGDMNNFIYGMWGTNVTGDTNAAPPVVTSDYTLYIDLSGSPNKVTVPFRAKSMGLGVQNSYQDGWRRGSVQGAPVTLGNLTLSIPLFYRVKWADMLSGEFKYKGDSLCKSDGYPLVDNIEKDGNIKLKIKYEEKANTDTSVVSLTPDHKIKTYFKNKPFTDATGTFYSGYKNLDGTGTIEVLNGTEWNKDPVTNEKEIKLYIPVKKGDSIWMRIDPLTSDGVYCAMTDISCEFVTE